MFGLKLKLDDAIGLRLYRKGVQIAYVIYDARDTAYRGGRLQFGVGRGKRSIICVDGRMPYKLKHKIGDIACARQAAANARYWEQKKAEWAKAGAA